MAHVNLKLTPRQAKLLWDTLDGALDAGSCKDGLSSVEKQGMRQILEKLIPFMQGRNRKARLQPRPASEDAVVLSNAFFGGEGR